MRTTFLRRTTLQVSQRRLTEARTFMKKEGTLVIMQNRESLKNHQSKLILFSRGLTNMTEQADQC